MKAQKGSHFRRIQPLISRRDFLKQAGIATGLAAGFTALGFISHSDEAVRRRVEEIKILPDFRIESSALYPQLAVVRGLDAELLVREAINLLGGIERFIHKGDRVLIKPNVGWDRQPEQAANTNPEVVAAVVKLCREAGAGDIRVTDVSLNDPQRCFSRSGIQDAAQNAGAKVVLPGSNDFVATDMGGELLKIWPVARFFHEADKVINIPIVKHHSLCGCTLAMKNWYGILGGRRNQLHQDIHTSIADLATAMRPTLTLMDATRVLKRNGPTGGSLADVAQENTLIAGLDEVALDSYSLSFLDLSADNLTFLHLAQQRGLGVIDWKRLRVAESHIAA
jgi:uncharacterized protein (DUF362 family)